MSISVSVTSERFDGCLIMKTTAPMIPRYICLLFWLRNPKQQKWQTAHLKKKKFGKEVWEVNLFAFLPRVQWEDWWHCVWVINMKPAVHSRSAWNKNYKWLLTWRRPKTTTTADHHLCSSLINMLSFCLMALGYRFVYRLESVKKHNLTFREKSLFTFCSCLNCKYEATLVAG